MSRKSAIAAEPEASAKAARLRYVHDGLPGIRRIRSGKGFRYVGADRKAIRDGDTLARIKSLVIPPAWTDVWICPVPAGHLQATGRDKRGRKQYRYHPKWRTVRDEAKYDRLIAFGQALSRIRRRVARDLQTPGLPREKLLATIVRLLETTLIRVGNEEYAKQNSSFGLTTMRTRHLTVSGANIHFEFRGKSGIRHAIDLEDPRLARILRRCQELPGEELFQYVDERGERHSIDSEHVNDYLHAITGEDFTAKDFRTWGGTVLAAQELETLVEYESAAEAKRNVVYAIETVARRLGNTRTICQKCYVHPSLINTYLDGRMSRMLNAASTANGRRSLPRLHRQETKVLEFLNRLLKEESRSA